MTVPNGTERDVRTVEHAAVSPLASLVLVSGSSGRSAVDRLDPRVPAWLTASGLSVLEVAVDLRRPRSYALGGIREAAGSLTGLPAGLPVLFGGVGSAAPLAGIVTVEANARGLLSIDGSLLGVSRRLRRWAGPTLFVASPGAGSAARLTMRASRLALGGQARSTRGIGSAGAGLALRDWRRASLGDGWPEHTGSAARRLAVPAAVALGLGGGVGLLSGTPVGATQRGGDGVSARAAVAPSRAKLNGQKLRRRHRRGDGTVERATGSKKLIDKAGFEWFVNTDITFSTSSSASGAMSEASYTHTVSASTLNGGVTHEKLNDSYDGYNSIFVSVNGTVCNSTGVANCTSYDKNGVAALACNNREVDLPVQVIGGLDVSRRDFVPADDHFERTLNVFSNPTTSAITATMTTSNNLGSDSNTLITGTSAGGTTISDSDEWVTTFQNFAAGAKTTTDPRLGHVLQTTGATVHATDVVFTNGSDTPHWTYTFTVPAGQTVEIANFAVADPTRADSMADSARLAALPPVALECMSAADEAELGNFGTAPTVTSQPTDQAVKQGTTATFTAQASAVGLGQQPSVQWQVSTNGGSTFSNLADQTSTTLTIADTPGTDNGNRYRAVFTNGIGSVTSASAALKVEAVGYRLVTAAGGILAFGASDDGSLVASGTTPGSPIVGIASTPDGAGYWMLGQDGGIFRFGDAKYRGSLAGHATSHVVGMASTPDGAGYWLASADGGVFPYGDAKFHGSLGSTNLTSPIVGIAATPDGAGYWLVGADGGVFGFGDAKYHGGLGSTALTSPIVGIAASPDGRGYWLVGADGGVFGFGDSHYFGSMGAQHLNQPIVGIGASPDGGGYLLAASDGGVFAFGDVKFLGSGAATPLASPVTGLSGS